MLEPPLTRTSAPWPIGLVAITASCSLFIELASGDKPAEDGTAEGAAGPGAGGQGAGGPASSTTGAGGASQTSSTGGQGGQGGAVPLVPLTGLLLWFDAEKGVTSNGGVVSRWDDQSGNVLDATQTVAGLGPTVGSIGSRPALDFDGVDDFMDLPQLTADLSTGLTMFAVVVASDPSVVTCPPIIQLSNAAEVDDISLHIYPDGSVAYEVYANVFITSPTVSSGVPTMISVVHDADATVRIDGAELGSVAMSPPVDVPRTTNYIGLGLYSGCGPWRGTIGEVLVYARALAAGEVTEVEAYLQGKWACCQ